VSTEELQVEVDGPIAIATVGGDVDATRAADLRGPLVDAPADHVVALLLDLSDVSFLDSGGVHLILDLRRELARRGFALHLVRPKRRTPSLVLDVTDVGAAIDIHADRTSALAAIDPAPDDDY
jgi:anti-anti-sigma factor